MKKEVVTFAGLALVIVGLIIVAKSTITTSYTARSEIWLSETVQVPATTYKMYSWSFPAGSIIWLEYRVIERDGVGSNDGYYPPPMESCYLSLFAVMDEMNYNKWQDGLPATYIKSIEGSSRATAAFTPPFHKTLYFVFENSAGLQPTDKQVTIDIVRLWNEYSFMLPSEAKYAGFILLVLGFVVACYGAVLKPKPHALKTPIKVLSTENFLRISTIVGLEWLIISALFTWVNVYNTFLLPPEHGYVDFYLAYSSSLSEYLLNLPMTIEALTVIYAQGFPDTAISLAVTFAAYCLALILGARSLFLSFRKKKGLFLGALLSGALSLVSGMSWTYAIHAAKTKPVWGSGFLTIDTGPYVAIAAAAIVLSSCYLHRSYKPTSQ